MVLFLGQDTILINTETPNVRRLMGVIMEVRSMDSCFQHRVGPSQLTDFKSEYCKNKLK